MRSGVVCGVLGGVLLAVAAVAGAAEPRLLTSTDLDAEKKTNTELRMYLDRNGLPDVAETRALSDKGPWDDHEVVLYYLDARKEIAFSRAYVLGDPWVSVQRIERALTDEDVAALSAQPSLRNAPEQVPGGEPVQVAALSSEDVDFSSTDPADRAEAAAFRAEQAAGRVEEAAVRTERAASRAEAVVEKMVTRRKR